MVRKMLSVFVLALAALFTFGGSASAQPAVAYPAPPVTIVVNVTVNITIINIGGVVILSGSGFDPGELIDITVAYSAPSGLRSSPALTEMAAMKRLSASADAAGMFTQDVKLSQVGTATITASGVKSGRTATVAVQVLSLDAAVPAGTTGGAGSSTYSAGSSTALASTGASVAGPIAIGLAALFAGLAMLFFGTRVAIRRKGSRSGGTA